MAPVQLVPVDAAPAIVRARSAAAPVVVDGDGEGIVAAAAAGLVNGERAVLQAAAFADQGELASIAGQQGATLVVTDTNRERARQCARVPGHDGLHRGRS